MISIIERGDLDELAYASLLVEASPQPIYTSLNFLDAIASYTKSKLCFVTKVEDNRILAALPFCVYEGAFGPVVNSLPFFGSNGGIVGRNRNPRISQEIIDHLLIYSKSIDCAAVTVIEPLLNREDEDVYRNFDFQDTRIGLINEIISYDNIESITKSFMPRARNSIKKAAKNNIKIVMSHSNESIDFLAKAHGENMTSEGRKAKNQDFFTYFLNELTPDHWIILEAMLDGKRIASLLLIHTSDFVEYFTPVTLAKYKDLQPMSLLILHGFVYAKEKRIRYWNWGGTWMNQSGVYRFKTQWNPMEIRYTYHTKILKDSILDLDTQEVMEAYPFFFVYPIK